MWLTRRYCLALGLVAATRAAAGVPVVDLLALRGFDPVSYRLPNGPKAGRPSYEVSWRGRVWRFSGAANRDAFLGAPEIYAPRLDGFDALGVAEGRLVDADPLVFLISGERLYLFRDAERRDRASAATFSEAETRWPSLRTFTDGAAPG